MLSVFKLLQNLWDTATGRVTGERDIVVKDHALLNRRELKGCRLTAELRINRGGTTTLPDGQPLHSELKEDARAGSGSQWQLK